MDSIEQKLENATHALLDALMDASDPSDRERLAAAVKHLQHAKAQGLTGVAGDDALQQLVAQAMTNKPDTAQ